MVSVKQRAAAVPAADVEDGGEAPAGAGPGAAASAAAAKLRPGRSSGDGAFCGGSGTTMISGAAYSTTSAMLILLNK
jgi:hypothetical protein